MTLVLLVGNDSESLRSLSDVMDGVGYASRRLVFAEQESTELDVRPDAVIFDLPVDLLGDAILRLLKGNGLDEDVVTLAALRLEQVVDFDMNLKVDDFFIWPCRPLEVQVRIRQALWRRSGLDPSSVIRAGDLLIDTANYKVYLDGRPVDLTYKEYELLRFLATNREKVFTREALLNRVWGYDYFGGARTVDVHIRRLRGKIETRSITYIETVRNVGYRFRAD